MFDERIFPGVVQEVVVVLTDGYRRGPAGHVAVHHARNLAGLSRTTGPRRWRPDPVGGKWTPALLSPSTLASYTGIVTRDRFTPLGSWGEIRNGAVTGDVTFFALSPPRVVELGLAASDLVPVCPPGSEHLRGLAFTAAVWAELGTAGERTWLFRAGGEPSPAARRYITSGEAAGGANAYKCRTRRPWWRVPLAPPAEPFDQLREHRHAAVVHQPGPGASLELSPRPVLTPQHGRLGGELLPLGALNTLTLLGAELVGRARGGGMLKLEPSEAARLPVPASGLVTAARTALDHLRPSVAKLLRERRLAAAVRLVDDVLLVGELGLSATQVAGARRCARGRAGGPATDRLPRQRVPYP